ncbi:MAG: mechanosensitive ion channel family protein [Cyanobacteria bacterium P01_G01_bin.19]
MPRRKKFLVSLFVLTTSICFWITPPAWAQLPFIQDLTVYSRLLRPGQNNALHSACIRLDGRCLFKLSGTDSEALTDRIYEIQKRFDLVTSSYLAHESDRGDVTIKTNGKLKDIYLTVKGTQERLFTVTNPDGRANDVNVDIRAQQLKSIIERGLATSVEEHSSQYQRKQIIVGTCILFLIWLGNLPLSRSIRKLRALAIRLTPSPAIKTLPLVEQLDRRQQWNLTEIKYRLLQLLQIVVWCGGTLFILNLFPQTRIVSFLLIAIATVPFRIIAVALLTYILIRLTFFIIAKLSEPAMERQSVDFKVNQRGKLRIDTTARILRSVVTVLWIIFGILLAFRINGVNLAPILAGAGIFGLGFSLASQNLIKDAINGFIIIWDDRYAVGDIVDIDCVSGLVENINLRITQLRDAEGRLITVPNSAVNIVANRSSQWSRADISIPVAYQSDINNAIAVIYQVAERMTQDPQWQEQIWEFPNILGVEQFSDRGIMIRVWIKTEPLKQWDVAREFRRRVKIALDAAGVSIPIPQQQILFEREKTAK